MIDLDAYSAFIDALCQGREYQKTAIHTVCRFLAGGEYSSTADLARENYTANPVLQDKYGSADDLLKALPFSDKLACDVDLATATGKSWVMYGIARILLAEGVVDRVLVLCPSLTIETGLREKFVALSTDTTLNSLIPAGRPFGNPEIRDANETTSAGDICIENVHATFEHVKSSVRDSFAGKGPTTLVLNDESHHVYSPPSKEKDLRKWKEFLKSDEFNFSRIVGLTGTAYKKDEYFTDVVARYSLRQAMEEGQVKLVEYVYKDESNTQDERFQKWLKVHKDNQVRYSDRKPLSIVVTATIAAAESLADDFTRFLADKQSISVQQAEERVVVVTSKHPAGVAKLPQVDRGDDSTEWIFSVSMLTEGWDVQNVFQIIPHEKRAFNSKLLISQVLGRGLRTGGLKKPVVQVFNHSKWSSEIKDLLDEVLEQERRLHAYPVTTGEHAKHHFKVHQLTYDTETTEQKVKATNGNGQIQLLTKGVIKFESQPKNLQRQTIFVNPLDTSERVVVSTIENRGYSVDEVAQKLRARLKSIDGEGGTDYSKEFPPKKLKAILEASLKEIDDSSGLVSERNLQNALRAIGTAQRRAVRSVRIDWKPKQLHEISTESMRSRSVGVASFRKEATVFYDSDSYDVSEDGDARILKEVIEDENLPKISSKEVPNKYHFKTPMNIVLASHEPERSFIRRLFEPDVAERLESWVKCPDSGFYEIHYSWRKGDHQKQARFNPDFLIRLSGSKDVLVIELKADDDDTDENRAKVKYASEHLDRINQEQGNVRYHMKFVSPESYDAFFQALRDETVTTFTSSLQAKLS